MLISLELLLTTAYIILNIVFINLQFFSQVKVLYVRNLMLSTTEETILRAFNKACSHDNAIERVKKLKDYAFVHFRERDLAIKAMNVMNGMLIISSFSAIFFGHNINVDLCGKGSVLLYWGNI
jgi:RNA recognition motif-containing protein